MERNDGERRASPPVAQPSKADRRAVKRKQLKLRSRVFAEKVRAINERRQALSYSTIFYFLALHRVEHTVFLAAPVLVRQAIFILFTHQVVVYGCRMKRLMQFKSSADLRKRQEPAWKKTLEWMQAAEKSIANTLDLSLDDRFVARVIRGLEEFVDLTLFPVDVVGRRRSRGIMVDAADKENVILNPMFAKRLLLNFAETFRAELIAHLHAGNLPLAEQGKTVNITQRQSAKILSTASSISEERMEAAPEPISLASIGLRKLSTLTFASGVGQKAAPAADADLETWAVHMSMDAIQAIQQKVCQLNVRTQLMIEDLAERVKHMPTLTSDLLTNAQPTPVSAVLKVAFSATSVEQEEPPESQSEPDPDDDEEDDVSSCMDVDNYVHIALLAATPDPDPKSEMPTKSEFATSPRAAFENRASDLPATAPAVLESSSVDMASWEKVCEVINLQVILLWSVFFRLLLDGIWDSGLERVCKDVARSLDVHDQFMLMLLAYAADAVCDALHDGPADEGANTQDVIVDSTTGEAIAVGTTLASVDHARLKQLARKHRNQNVMKGLKIAGMSVGVGALSALTAGLAAPAFAAGFGALGIAGTSSLTAFLGSAGGAASLASVFGASSASLSGWKYSRRLADIRVCAFIKLDNDNSNHSMDAIGGYIHEIIEYKQKSKALSGNNESVKDALTPLQSRTNDLNPRSILICRPLGLHHLRPDYSPGSKRSEPPFRLTIGVSGWLREAKERESGDLAKAGWEFLRDCLGTESYVFQWEPQLLRELGFMMVRLLGENVAYQAATLSIQIALSASAGFIMWPVSFIQYAGQLDNAWMTAKERAQQAGVILAAAICDKAIVGNRPVTLIGCSMGSRVITYCLKELYTRQEFFRVADVILMGLPDGKNKEDWRKMRSVVTGRLINVFNSSDFILIFLYRWMEWGVSVAGLSPVEGVAGVENFDASGLIESHYQYEDKLPDLLSLLKIHSSLVKFIKD